MSNAPSPSESSHQATIVFIGGGNMAQALIGGLLAGGWPKEQLLVVEPYAPTRADLVQRFSIEARESAADMLAGANVVVLAVKPQVMQEVCAALKPQWPDALVISVAAGIRAGDLARWLGTERIVRTMPNMPALVHAGITGLAALPGAGGADRALADRILKAVGTTLWVEDEDKLDGVTALSGSGPAYVFHFLEAMQEAAAQLGFTPEQGRELAITTFTGASKLAAQSSESAATLRERVTSKGGTTHAALTRMAEGRVKENIVAGVLAAAARGKAMGDEFGS
jgi:pyrroline-5-carboxylate reductase